MSTSDDHIWFDEHLATYLAGGLSGDDRARFESHAAACPACAAELETAKRDERQLTALFHEASPRAGFEDRIIARLRTSSSRRLRIHPLIPRLAATAAAVVIVGGVGYVGSNFIRSDANAGRTAATGRHIGQAMLNDARNDAVDRGGEVLRLGLDAGQAPTAETWNFTGGANGAVDWSNWNDATPGRRELSESYANSGPEFRDKRAAGEAKEKAQDRDSTLAETLKDGSVPADQQVVLGQPFYFKPAEQRPGGTAAGEPVIAGRAIDVVQKAAEPESLAAGAAEKNQPTAGVAGAPISVTANLQQLAEQAPPPPATAPSQRKIIRHGEVAFEVDSFDSAVATIGKVVAEEGGFIATTSSEKLDNGKVKGAIVVRVPPDRLDTLVLKLRALGELKRQNLSVQDVSKQYTDLESELRAARAMEERLIEIIKSGKGEIKDLLAAEKELANWRGKIEKITGEINYYNNLIALSTLSIELAEKNISTAAATIEQEEISAGVEAEDVESARNEVTKSLDEAKGRIIESELKKLDAGQLAAKIVAEVPPENAGPVLDRLKQLGKVARLDVQRRQSTPGGAAPVAGARVETKPTRLVVSLYNLANVAPRQTSNLNLACDDVEAAYRQILARVEKAGGRIVSSAVNREKPNQITGTINFETSSAESGAVLLDVRGLGEVLRLAVTENPDTANVTTAKHGFAIQLFSTAQIAPRETITLQVGAPDVARAYHAVVELAKSQARILSSQVDEKDRQNVTGTLDLEIPRANHDALIKALDDAGDVLSRTVVRSSDTENTLDSKLRVQVTLIGADRVPPRESTQLGVQTSNVDAAAAKVASLTSGAGGRVLESHLAREPDGRSTGRMLLDVPLGKNAQVIDQIRSIGQVRAERATKNAQVPEGELSRARIEVVLASPEAIVAGDRGIWSSIREGLSTSFAGLMWSLRILVIGLCFVVPWGLVLWGAWKLLKSTRLTPA